MQRPTQALRGIDRPGAAAYLDAGIVASMAGDHEAAAEAYRAALRRDPSLLPAHNNLALALRAQNRFERAEAAARAGLRHGPDAAPLHHTLGLILRDLRRHSEAATAHAWAIATMPDFAPAYLGLGNARRTLGDTAGAEQALRTARRLDPADPASTLALAMLLLATGRHDEGWSLHEARVPGAGVAFSDAPGWDGAPTTETVLIEAEQGFGDTIQFSRLLPEAARRAPVIARMPPSLVRLLAALPGSPRIVSNAEPPPPHTLACRLMSLPHLLGVAGAPVPYLTADPARWTARLAPLPGPRVGLAWAGGMAFAEAADKVLPAAQVERLLRLPASFVSLQVGPAPKLRTRLFDPTAELADFSQTAELIAALDLVISVDTAVAHLAGAMGKPVWLLDRADGCWRWQPGFGPDGWYPTLRIFRQNAIGDFCGPVDAVLAAYSSTFNASARA